MILYDEKKPRTEGIIYRIFYPRCIPYSFIQTVYTDKSIQQLYMFVFNVVSHNVILLFTSQTIMV